MGMQLYEIKIRLNLHFSRDVIKIIGPDIIFPDKLCFIGGKSGKFYSDLTNKGSSGTYVQLLLSSRFWAG